MGLLLGTFEGLYRTEGVAFDDAEQVLEGRCGAYSFEATDELFAVSDGEIYSSTDDGHTWDRTPSPDDDVTELHAGPAGERLYAGLASSPVTVAVSTDRGESWERRGGFPELPTLEHYVPQQDEMRPTPQSVHVSRIGVPDTLPSRLVVGMDPAGVYVSDDGGETWTPRRYGLSDDVHDLAVLTPTQYLAACWGGIYATGDAGRSWTQLLTHQGVLRYSYVTALAVDGASIYAGAAAEPPGRWGGDLGIDAVLLESEDFGESFAQCSYPGGPGEAVTSLAVADGRVVGGTMADTWDGRDVSRGRVVARTESGSWKTAGRVPAGVTSIATT